MRILTVGGGGREHAVVEALHRSGAEIYAAMKNTNPGIVAKAKVYKIMNETDIDNICEFAIEHDVELAFIGPESPLEIGLVDALENIGVKCAAPTMRAARIETSKSFMREMVTKYNIKGNLDYAVFHTATAAEEYLKGLDHEIVVKPVGLTGGKGVKVQGEHLNNHKETMDYINEILSNVYGKEGVILEEKVVGEEFTQMIFVDGKNIAPMPLVQDHKRAYAGDVGPNTGGMGSYSDSNHLLPFVTEKDRTDAIEILQSLVLAMHEEGCPYRGSMYGQFMLTADGPRIIEINARFGDPEAMNVLSIMETNFLSVMKDIVTGKLKDEVKFKPLATVCKYVVPKGYGIESETGTEICINEEKINENENAAIYYANVDLIDGKIVTGTSRSIGVVGMGETLEEANANCENALEYIQGDAICVRHDIGTRELIQKKIERMLKIRP